MAQGVFEMQLSPMAATQRRSARYADSQAPEVAPTAVDEEVAAKVRALLARSLETITQLAPQKMPVQSPRAQRNGEPEGRTRLSDRDAAEFSRQWAQLQDELQKKAIDDVGQHHVTFDAGEMGQLRQKDKSVQSALAERGQISTSTRERESVDSSIFAGELCVTSASGQSDIQLALPCVGDNYIADFSWHARVHAPKRGEPGMRQVDPTGRVFVQNFAFAPATLAAYRTAAAELAKIQVSVRMVYLPELRLPIQLLSRDNRVGAIAAEAFSTEDELAAYLRAWTESVRRWASAGAAGAQAPTPGVGAVASPRTAPN